MKELASTRYLLTVLPTSDFEYEVYSVMKKSNPEDLVGIEVKDQVGTFGDANIIIDKHFTFKKAFALYLLKTIKTLVLPKDMANMVKNANTKFMFLKDLVILDQNDTIEKYLDGKDYVSLTLFLGDENEQPGERIKQIKFSSFGFKNKK
jgi:hypothetical protein